MLDGEGRVVLLDGGRNEQGFAAALGIADVRSGARPSPGYPDHDWEHGNWYPGMSWV